MKGYFDMASINYDYLEDAELYNSGLIEEKMLEMYKKGQFESAKGSVLKVSEESKNSSNKTRARKILGLKDEDDSSEEKEKLSSSSSKEMSSESDAK